MTGLIRSLYPEALEGISIMDNADTDRRSGRMGICVVLIQSERRIGLWVLAVDVSRGLYGCRKLIDNDEIYVPMASLGVGIPPLWALVFVRL